MSVSTHTQNDQFVRQFFDALYAFKLDQIVEIYRAIPKRAKILILTSVIAMVIVWVYYQGATRALDAIEWSNRPALETRLDPPFDLMTRSTPGFDPARLTLQEVMQVDQEALQEKRSGMLEYAQANAVLVAQRSYEMTINAGLGVAADQAEEGSEIPVVTVEQFMPRLDNNAITSHILPDVDTSYFQVLGNYNGYYRLHVNQFTTVDPVQSCLMDIDLEVDESPACGLPTLPMFIEGADYMNAEGGIMRALVARYETPEEATAAIKALQRTTRQFGDLRNYSMANITPVKWYAAITPNGRSFVWSNGEWVYMVAAPSFDDVDNFIAAFPH